MHTDVRRENLKFRTTKELKWREEVEGKVGVARGGVVISARSSVPRGRASASAAAACHHAFTLAAT